MIPRAPTEEELEELLDYRAKYVWGSREEAIEHDALDARAIAVFDHYTTDCPGYSGRVLVIVWSGDPAYTETYIWSRVDKPGKPQKELKKVEIEV